jgi:hypothetical protein
MCLTGCRSTGSFFSLSKVYVAELSRSRQLLEWRDDAAGMQVLRAVYGSTHDTGSLRMWTS